MHPQGCARDSDGRARGNEARPLHLQGPGASISMASTSMALRCALAVVVAAALPPNTVAGDTTTTTTTAYMAATLVCPAIGDEEFNVSCTVCVTWLVDAPCYAS